MRLIKKIDDIRKLSDIENSQFMKLINYIEKKLDIFGNNLYSEYFPSDETMIFISEIKNVLLVGLHGFSLSFNEKDEIKEYTINR